MEITTTLPTIDLTDNETGCCPRFHPELWDEKIFTFSDIQFARTTSKNILHIPINLGKVMAQSMERIDGVRAMKKEQYLILSRDLSPWKSEHLFAVTKKVPGMKMVSLTGTFYAKVYDGPYKDMPKLMKDFQLHAKSKGMAISKNIYVFYTTCPKCAKYYKHNYMVLFSKNKPY